MSNIQIPGNNLEIDSFQVFKLLRDGNAYAFLPQGTSLLAESNPQSCGLTGG